MLLKTITRLKREKSELKNFFREKLKEQMEVLNEDFGELLQEQKIFYEHMNGLQNKAGFLLECLNGVKRTFSANASQSVSEKQNVEDLTGEESENVHFLDDKENKKGSEINGIKPKEKAGESDGNQNNSEEQKVGLRINARKR